MIQNQTLEKLLNDIAINGSKLPSTFPVFGTNTQAQRFVHRDLAQYPNMPLIGPEFRSVLTANFCSGDPPIPLRR